MSPVIKRIRIANPAAGLLTIMANGRKAAAARKAAQQRAAAGGTKWNSGASSQAHTRKAQSQRGGVSYMKTKTEKKRSFKRNPVAAMVIVPKKRSASPAAKRRNPHVFMKSKKRRSFKRNPSVGGMTLMTIGKLGVGAVAGTIGTRGIPSLVLKDKNVGAVGILANLLTGGLLTFGASKMDTSIAAGVAAGSFASVFQRVWDVYIAKVLPDGSGKPTAAATVVTATSNTDGTPKLGDVSYSGDGLGYYSKATWPAPTAAAGALPIAGQYGDNTSLLPADQSAFKPAFSA
jgi:hypothetical protein